MKTSLKSITSMLYSYSRTFLLARLCEGERAILITLASASHLGWGFPYKLLSRPYISIITQCTWLKDHTSLPSEQSYQNNKLSQLLLELSSNYGPINKPLENDRINDQNVKADHFSMTFWSKFNVEMLAGRFLKIEKWPMESLFKGVKI